MTLQMPSFLSIDSSRILTQIALAYSFDLNNFEQDIYLRLEQEGYERLVLERQEPHIISLSHYFVHHGDLISDPDVNFLLRRTHDTNNLLFYPLTITQSVLNLYEEVAFLNLERNCLESYKPYSMQDLAGFCNQWATNIKNQSWFLDSAQPNPQVKVTTY